MVEIMAIIRPNKTAATKQALIDIGYPGYTCIKAVGRGKKPVRLQLEDGTVLLSKLVIKRVFLIVVEEAAREALIKAIMDVNYTGNPGDGKIFISRVCGSYNVHKQMESKVAI